MDVELRNAVVNVAALRRRLVVVCRQPGQARDAVATAVPVKAAAAVPGNEKRHAPSAPEDVRVSGNGRCGCVIVGEKKRDLMRTLCSPPGPHKDEHNPKRREFMLVFSNTEAGRAVKVVGMLCSIFSA